MKEIKRIGILGIVFLSMLLPTIVKAEKVCITHKNYYFFSEIYGASIGTDDNGQNTYNGFLNTINSLSSTDKHSTNRSTYFPTVPENATAPEGNSQIIKSRICLKKTYEDGSFIIDGKEAECANGNTMTLEEYYRLRSNVISKGIKKSLDTEKGESSYTIYEEKKEDAIYDYLWHGRWFRLDGDNDDIDEGGASVDFNSVAINNLTSGSFLPENTDIGFDLFKTGRVTIKRDIFKKDIFNDDNLLVTPFKVAWKANGTEKNSLLAPALYYIEYDICGDKYNATINYYYYDTTDRVKNDDGKEVPAHTEKELDPGYTKSVNSPKISGCKIVDENGDPYDEDKVVEVSIDKTNPKNFTKNVYYICPGEKEGEELPTGDALIYIAWIIGLGAIGYSVYYFVNLKKENKAEI